MTNKIACDLIQTWQYSITDFAPCLLFQLANFELVNRCLSQGSSTSGLWPNSGPWTIRNWAAEIDERAHAHSHLHEQQVSMCMHTPFVWGAGAHVHCSWNWSCTRRLAGCSHGTIPHRSAKKERVGTLV